MPAKAIKPGESIYPGMTYLKRLRCKRGIVGAIVWSPDGRFLAVPTDDFSVFLWEMETGNWQPLDFRQTSRLCSVAWSPDSRCLVAGFHSGRVMLWDVPGLQWVEQKEVGSLPARLVWSTDLHNCAVIADERADNVVMLNSAARAVRKQPPPIQTLAEPSAGALSLSVSADGALLVTSSSDGTHRLWSLDDGRCITMLNPDPLRWYTTSADFHPSKHLLASSGRTVNEIDLWEYDTELLVHSSPLGNALSMVHAHHGERPAPRCYISRAPAQEKWAARLAEELRNAGVEVLNQPARLQGGDWLLVAGSPEYLDANPDEAVLGARIDFEHLPPERCLPLLVKGEWASALPMGFKPAAPIPYDFTDPRMYHIVFFDLVLALYGIAIDHQGAEIWRKELRRLLG